MKHLERSFYIGEGIIFAIIITSLLLSICNHARLGIAATIAWCLVMTVAGCIASSLNIAWFVKNK